MGLYSILVIDYVMLVLVRDNNERDFSMRYDVRINETQRRVMVRALSAYRRTHPRQFTLTEPDTCVLVECFEAIASDEIGAPGHLHDFTPPPPTRQ